MVEILKFLKLHTICLLSGVLTFNFVIEPAIAHSAPGPQRQTKEDQIARQILKELDCEETTELKAVDEDVELPATEVDEDVELPATEVDEDVELPLAEEESSFDWDGYLTNIHIAASTPLIDLEQFELAQFAGGGIPPLGPDAFWTHVLGDNFSMANDASRSRLLEALTRPKIVNFIQTSDAFLNTIVDRVAVRLSDTVMDKDVLPFVENAALPREFRLRLAKKLKPFYENANSWKGDAFLDGSLERGGLPPIPEL